MTAPIWPFIPKSGMTEAIEWLTNVVTTRQSEWREQLRQYPLRELPLTHAMDAAKASHARYLARNALVFRVPDWAHIVRANAATGVYVGLPPGEAIVWRDWNDYEEVSITSSGTLGTVAKATTNVRVMSLLTCRVLDAYNLTRPAGPAWEGAVTFQTADGQDESATTRYAAYGGYALVTDAKRIGSGSVTESVTWEADQADNSIALPVDAISREWQDEAFAAAWYVSRSEWPDLRAWLYSRYGQYVPFLLPSWADDCTGKSKSGQTLIVAEYDPEETRLYVEVAGVCYARTVTAHTYSLGQWVLTLDIALPGGTIGRVMYLRLVRFSADRIEVQHNAGQGYAVVVNCVRVPE